MYSYETTKTGANIMPGGYNPAPVMLLIIINNQNPLLTQPHE